MINIKICTYPRSEISIQHDINIIKSILLYADKIEIVSPNTSMLFSICTIPNLPEQQKIELISELTKIGNNSPQQIKEIDLLVSEYNRLSRKTRKVGNDLKEFLMIKNGLTKVWCSLKSGIEDNFGNTGIKQLLPLVEDNILTINMIGSKEEDFESDKYSFLIEKNIIDSVLNDNYYPLFDEKIGNLAGSMAREGIFQLTNAKKERTNHIAFTSNILDKLPNFTNQSIDELLDIRKDLNKYLNHFRASMIRYSSMINDLPWDNDFQKESEKLILSEIVPSVCEIDEQVKSNKYLFKLIKTFVDEPLTVPPATGLGFLVSRLSDLPALTSLGLGVLAGTGSAILKSTEKWYQEKKNIEKNQLYFYYKAKNETST